MVSLPSKSVLSEYWRPEVGGHSGGKLRVEEFKSVDLSKVSNCCDVYV
jgi:hypothetical protein